MADKLIVACIVRDTYYECISELEDDFRLYGKFHVVQCNGDAVIIQRFKYDQRVHSETMVYGYVEEMEKT